MPVPTDPVDMPGLVTNRKAAESASAGPGTDLHHLRAEDVTVNGTRGNKDFDNGGTAVSGCTDCWTDSDSFEPRDAVKGDVARMLFYMAVRYEGDDGFTDLELSTVSGSAVPRIGDLDVLLAPELLEVGRAIEAGFPSPARTTIVASTHRLYSIHEKMAAGDGVYPAEELKAAAARFARRFLGFDALAAARAGDTEVNAVLLGALAGTGVLPIHPDSFRKAIERKGVQVDANLRGLDIGLDLAQAGEPPASFEALASYCISNGFALDLERPDLEALCEIADEEGASVASVVRKAIKTHLARRRR